MPRYIIKAWIDYGTDHAPAQQPVLMVDCQKPVNTGLVTAEGDQIWRSPEPLGFLPPKEDDDGRH